MPGPRSSVLRVHVSCWGGPWRPGSLTASCPDQLPALHLGFPVAPRPVALGRLRSFPAGTPIPGHCAGPASAKAGPGQALGWALRIVPAPSFLLANKGSADQKVLLRCVQAAEVVLPKALLPVSRFIGFAGNLTTLHSVKQEFGESY